jgi:hypothetical protein
MKLTAAVPLAASAVGSGIATYSLAVSKGYYAILIQNTIGSGIINIPTDSYTCPYTAGSTDAFATFIGCTASTTSVIISGVTCLRYVGTSSNCEECISSYKVVNGACVYNPCGLR